MPDDVIVEPNVPEAGSEEFNYIVDDTPQKDEATLALEAKVQELEAEKAKFAEMQQQGVADAGLNKLAEQIAAMQMNQPKEEPKPTEPAIDPNALIEEVNKGFYDNPAVNVMKLLNPIVQNIQQQNASKDAERDLQISKLSILADEDSKGTYAKYRDEVEAIVASQAPSQTVYKEALGKVRMAHMDEIIAEQVQAKVDALTQEALAQTPPSVPPKAQSFTNATAPRSLPPEPQANEHEKVHRADVPKVQQWMLTQGLQWNMDDDRDWAISYLREKGAIK